MEPTGNGLRFNSGKLRYELVPVYAQEEYVRVLSAGAKKYGDHNWRLGMPWTTVMACIERHLMAVKKGEDYDPETGLLHTAHIMANSAFLTQFYKDYPQGDDRLHKYQGFPIALDWVSLFTDNTRDVQEFIHVQYVVVNADKKESYLENKYNLEKPILSWDELISKKNLILITADVDRFVSESKKGICCFLYNTPQNKYIEVGFKRIKHINELK